MAAIRIEPSRQTTQTLEAVRIAGIAINGLSIGETIRMQEPRPTSAQTTPATTRALGNGLSLTGDSKAPDNPRNADSHGL